MSSRPLRFIQAGDFHLHQPVSGLMEVPDHLVERLVEAPYRAAERVFDAALAADADFLLLTGNLCDPHRAGPRGLIFLQHQFARLSQRGIAIYWAASEIDGRKDWPTALEWPKGVHVFSADRVEHLTHHRNGAPICHIAGRSIDSAPVASTLPAADFAPIQMGLFAIAVFPYSTLSDPNDVAKVGNNYWAFGGSKRIATTRASVDPQCVVHYSGTPQAQSPQNVGACGCTLVHVDVDADAHEHIHLTPIATDVVRWHGEQIALPALADDAEFAPAELDRHLHERMRALIEAEPHRTLLIRWHITGSQSATDILNQSSSTAELLAALRTEYGFRESPAWSVSLTIEPPVLPPSWSEQQTLLGEFLRHLHAVESASVDSLELDCFLSPRQLATPLAERVNAVDAAARASVLRKAALLGADLLSSGAVRRDAVTSADSPRAKGAIAR